MIADEVLSNFEIREWKVINSRNFTVKEQTAVTRAEVISTEYGLSVCFLMQDENKITIPLSSSSLLKEGDLVDMTQAKLLTLHREGCDDINRIEI